MTNLHGYALAKRLREESEDIAREDRAALVAAAAQEIADLVQQNRALSEALERLKNSSDLETEVK